MNPVILGYVRHTITLFAGMFLAKTSLSPDDIETLASAAVVLINLGWYTYSRHRAGDLRIRKGRRP